MRIGHTRVASARHTARIKVNENCMTEDGQNVFIEDFSFEYIRFKFEETEANAVNLIKEFPNKIVLYPQESYRMVCVPSGFNQYIYKIENFRELERSDAWHGKIVEWENANNQKKKKGRRKQ